MQFLGSRDSARRDHRLAPIAISAILFVVLALQLNPVAHAQCNTQNPTAVTGQGYRTLLRYFTPNVMGCMVAVDNAIKCTADSTPMLQLGCSPTGPSVTGPCIRVAAGVTSYPTMMSSCVFACTPGCPLFTIDGPNDGLPVELMEFSVEPEDSEDASNRQPVTNGKPAGDREG